MALLLEFLFATPAIAVALGQYIHFLIPSTNGTLMTFSMIILVLFINLFKVSKMATIEIIVTSLALLGLIVFYLTSIHQIIYLHPSLNTSSIPSTNIFAAIPFAIWLFLATEGGAIAAGEVKLPVTNIIKGFIAALLTLTLCSLLSVGFSVFLSGNNIAHLNSPLPYSIKHSGFFSIFVALMGIFGLFASLNGITMAYSRQVYTLSKTKKLPKFLAKLSAANIPTYGLLVPGMFIIILATSAHISEMLVTISAFSAIIMYILTMLAFLKLRISHKHHHRPLKVPFIFGIIALILALIFLPSVFFYMIIAHHISIFGFHCSAWAFLLFIWILILLNWTKTLH